ncbi:MAG: molybdopterin oxidoreductase family protein [Epsilonproteobacteria bacterium]|nr:molybdopterin oxidoreductase family protein [Campylobacterota bacterium]
MIRSVCGYCGVGCGLEFDEKKLVGDLTYPINEGVVCAKGVSELMTMQTPTRLLRPYVRKDFNSAWEKVSWELPLDLIVNKIKKSDPQKIGIYLSGQLLTEDYYVANKLGKGFIGTNNVDTNSRMCMASAVVGYEKALGLDYVPVRMEDLNRCNLLIIIGANPAEAHVVFSNRIKQAKKSGMKVVVIDPRYTETAAYADLYLPIRPGADIDFLNLVALRLITDNHIDHQFLENSVNGYDTYLKKIKKQPKTKLLKRTGLTKAQFEVFMKLFYENENIISAWTMGLNQSVQGVDKNLAVINLHLLTGKINSPGNGPFSLTGQPNAMGGREVGGLATTLAVHLGFDTESIQKVSSFWQTDKISDQVGLTAFEMIEAAERGELDLLIICHTDPIYHLPNRKRVEAAFEKIDMVVEINAYEDSESAKFAHIRLPATPWGEKEGTQTNMDRTVTKQEKLTRRSIDCKDDWEIFTLIGQKLGFSSAFDYQHPKEIFNEYKEMTRLSRKGHLNLYESDYDALREKPFIWGEKLYKEQGFLTPNHKASLHFIENLRLSETTNLKYPYMLITGRIKDQWHSTTKTGVVRQLLRHKKLSFVEINSSDAKVEGIKSGDIVDVMTARGTLSLSAVVTDAIREKTLFIPVTERKINYLTTDLLDHESKQPDYNQNAAAILKRIST